MSNPLVGPRAFEQPVDSESIAIFEYMSMDTGSSPVSAQLEDPLCFINRFEMK